MNINSRKIYLSTTIHGVILICFSFVPISGFFVAIARSLVVFCLLFCVISLLVNLAKFIINKRKSVKYPLILFFKPSILLAISIASCFYLNQTVNNVSSLVREKAEEIQVECTEKNICPKTPNGWVSGGPNNSMTTYMVGPTAFNIRYFPHENYFNMVAYVGFELGYGEVHGGVNIPVGEGCLNGCDHTH